MRNLWSDEESRLCADDIALRVYSSRRLGAEPGAPG